MSEFVVRGFQMGDWEDVAELFLAPECIRGTLQLPFQSKDEIRHKLENPDPSSRRLVATTADGSRVVGMLHLQQMRGRRAHSGAIGMFVHPEFHRRGVGSALMEAMIELGERWMGLERIQLEVFVDNDAAIGLYEKFGFEREGILRRFARRDGEYVDVLAMARLRPGADEL